MRCIQSLAVFFPAIAVATLNIASAQAPTSQKSLAAAVGVHAFPSEGQKYEQQSKDEHECYEWAVKNSGVDPFQVNKQAQQQTAMATQNAQAEKAAGTNAGAKGTLKGAAAGTVVGAIAGDTGKGAAIGAGVGLVAGRAKKRRAEEEAQGHVQQAEQTQQAAKEQMNEFKKGFGACLEAKKYLVKY